MTTQKELDMILDLIIEQTRLFKKDNEITAMLNALPCSRHIPPTYVSGVRRRFNIESGQRLFKRVMDKIERDERQEEHRSCSVRKCLRCESKFQSEGNHNRICSKCKGDKTVVDWRATTEHSMFR